MSCGVGTELELMGSKPSGTAGPHPVRNPPVSAPSPRQGHNQALASSSGCFFGHFDTGITDSLHAQRLLASTTAPLQHFVGTGLSLETLPHPQGSLVFLGVPALAGRGGGSLSPISSTAGIHPCCLPSPKPSPRCPGALNVCPIHSHSLPGLPGPQRP